MRLAGCKPRPHQCPSPAAPPTTSAPPPVAPINLHPTPVQAPSKPKSPTGEMAAYYLQMQPHLFREAVAGAFSAIRDARDADAHTLHRLSIRSCDRGPHVRYQGHCGEHWIASDLGWSVVRYAFDESHMYMTIHFTMRNSICVYAT